MSALVVIEGGFFTTVQDRGRPGFQRFGMPVSGALDGEALALANAVAGNETGEAALEIIGPGPVLRLDGGNARIAVAGLTDGFSLAPANGSAERRISACRSVRLEQGDMLRLPAPKGGLLYYLAVEGGFALEPVLGSLATYARAGIGGLDGRALRSGGRLTLRRENAQQRGEMRLNETLAAPSVLRVLPGPQADRFAPGAMDNFLSTPWVVSPSSDRMGLRITGQRLRHKGPPEIASQGLAAGAIQAPGSGEPICLLVDRQTTGGYPVIATIIGADLAAAGRLAPGMTVRFQAVSRDEALAARREKQVRFKALTFRLEAVTEGDLVDTSKLLSENLIGGVTDGYGA
jgi:biotin-dependent carboxylase-like uncharacterized protein